MTPDEIAAALSQAFSQCERATYPLTSEQRQILLRVFGVAGNPAQELAWQNPLAELTPEERDSLLAFVRAQELQNRSWKTTLLNDWLQGQESGAVQFLRDRYGIQWLEQIQGSHLAAYLENGETLPLQVGDRIEVANSLWEWVQENDPCSREWFPCTIIGVTEADDGSEGLHRHASCLVRFDTGAEYEIQGVYEWNRPNWRVLRA